jgi:DNA-directed RNA polymerase subunit RPC12/RpoP
MKSNRTKTGHPSVDIRFNCPRCGQHLSVEERGAGMLVNCPSCKGQIQIPLGTAPEAPNISVPATPMVFHVAREGAEIGQFSEEQFRHNIRVGKIKPGDHYWTEGMDDWRSVSEYPSLPSPSGPPPLPPVPQVPKKKQRTERFFL